MLDQLMYGIMKASEEGYTWDEGRLKELVSECLKRLGHFAIVVHFLDHLLRSSGERISGEAMVDLIQNYRSMWSDIRETQARQLRSVQRVSEQTILLHSHSSSIVGMFEVLAENTDLSKTIILQSISHPAKEGLIQGGRLANQGWKVRIIEDAAMGKMLLQCDYVILGSDVLTSSTFVNKIGSMSIASVARHLQKPVYVLGDERKLVNEENLPSALSSKLMTESPRSDKEMNLKKGQVGINYYFEHVPCDWVNGFVLSNGVYTPNDLRELIGNHGYSKELLEEATSIH